MSMMHLLAGILTKSAPVTSMAFHASEMSTLETITCPSVQAYDVGVLFDWAADISGPPQVVPTGFTLLRGDAQSVYRGTVSYKVFTGVESGSTITGQLPGRKILLVFRPNGVIKVVTASTWLGETTSGNPSAQTISASGQAAPLIRLAGGGISVASTPTFSVGTFDGTVSGSTAMAGYAIQNSSPSDDSPDMTDYGGTNWLTTGYLRFS